MNCGFCFINNPKVIIIRTNFSCLLKINPYVAINFRFLHFYVIRKGSGKEKYNTLAYFTKGTILANFMEVATYFYIKVSFLFNFTNRSFFFCFAFFNMTFWETPISSVIIFYKKNIYTLFSFVKNYCATRFFIKALYAFDRRILY